MGYKTEIAKFFRGKWLTGDFMADASITHSQISTTAGILGSQLSASAGIAGTQLTAGTLTTTQLSASAGITGTQLASNAAIAGTQLASNAGIASTQLAAGVVKVLTGTIAHADTTKNVIAMPANALVTDVIAVCTETWNGAGASLELGISGTLEGFIAAAKMGKTATNVTGTTLSDRGTLLWAPLVLTFSDGNADTITTQGSPIRYYTGASPVNLVGTVGGSAGANGATTVYCVYVALA